MDNVTHFFRAHLGAAIAATATAVVLVGGVLILTAAGSVTRGSTPAGTSTPLTTSTTAPAPSAATSRHHHGVRGRITAISSTSWTVTSAHGASVTVQLAPSTAFGSKAAPLAASDFSVGDMVVVSGTRTKATVTASRIAKPKAPATASAAPAAPTAPASPRAPAAATAPTVP